MVFNSLTFAVFFLALLVLGSLKMSWRSRKVVLLVASYVFYSAWNPPFASLLLLSTGFDFVAAKQMHAAERSSTKRLWLFGSLALNLGLLAYFKSGGFVLDNFVAALAALGVDYVPAPWSVVLPMGISFYTFQTMSYSIDVYRGRMTPSSSVLDFALFVSFFPQLVAGPIVRATDFLPQLAFPRKASAAQIRFGLVLLSLGLFEKVVIADAILAPIADAMFIAAPHTVASAWVGALSFAGQIFCDFAGYSTCAIGVALCLGFSLPNNFRFPYAALGFSDFWRRWHISLSQWLRDYLYVSLGGNRAGELKRYRNLALTMLLGGLWHGASWTFVVWGALHGGLLVVERALKRSPLGQLTLWTTTIGKLVIGALTFGCVCVTWVWFRAPDLLSAWQMTLALFGRGALGLGVPGTTRILLAVFGCGLVVVTHIFMRERELEDVVERAPRPLLVVGLAFLWLALLLTPGNDRAFIYFQF